jgi:hypothetical protein
MTRRICEVKGEGLKMQKTIEIEINGEKWVARKPTLREVFALQNIKPKQGETLSPEESARVMIDVLQKTIIQAPPGYDVNSLGDLPADLALELFDQIMGSTLRVAKKLQKL